MSGECHFCHGIVSADESNHILLDGHGDHEVYLHRQCAAGHDVLEDADGSADNVAITCPECGTVETH
ncbi:hypothetical protein [Haloarcula montana]|uniref:hypothetical protein n=1 Tax=Haloarcula montana TaxID=3111776 RepID=UPI002D77E205|nr:hypothetical protein [Haloarcula sp. GH36]